VVDPALQDGGLHFDPLLRGDRSGRATGPRPPPRCHCRQARGCRCHRVRSGVGTWRHCAKDFVSAQLMRAAAYAQQLLSSNFYAQRRQHLLPTCPRFVSKQLSLALVFVVVEFLNEQQETQQPCMRPDSRKCHVEDRARPFITQCARATCSASWQTLSTSLSDDFYTCYFMCLFLLFIARVRTASGARHL
jgi:hypothetical protein